MRLRLSVLLILFATAVLVERLTAATLRSGFSETVIASGLASPTAMAFAPDGRLFVAQQGGALRVVKDGALLPTPFLTVTVNASGERGLLGVAFDPDFLINGHVYVYYTATQPTVHNRVSRFTANGDVAVAGSELPLLNLPTLGATNHNGGAMHFGPDGLLYVAVGENANAALAQSLQSPLGKMLRIARDGSIPASNPFFGQTTGDNRAIWALGLRNPFTFSFDSFSGRMLINDVGQNTWEEINDGLPGANYGWPQTEGPTNAPGITPPLYAYNHGSSNVCAITGGAFYPTPASQFPSSYAGDYFFADFCGGWIRQYDFTTGVDAQNFASGISAPVDLKVGPEGALYYLARGPSSTTGTVVRIDYVDTQAPSITQHPADRTVSIGQPATFTVGASGGAPLSYQWQRDGADIQGATDPIYTLASTVASDSGARFRVRVSNASGAVLSNAATLTVVPNQPPAVSIARPAAGSTYVAGGLVSYSGTANDPEEGPLDGSRFTWEVVFHHDTHTHPFLGPISGVTSGSFVVPDTGETAANVWYRVSLTVADSTGQASSTFVDVRPRTVQLTLASNPSGLGLTLDGQPVTAGHSVLSVVGMRRTIGAPSPQTQGNTTYEFRSWSDRGAQVHEIVTPTRNTTYTASYRKRRATGTLTGATAVARSR